MLDSSLRHKSMFVSVLSCGRTIGTIQLLQISSKSWRFKRPHMAPQRVAKWYLTRPGQTHSLLNFAPVLYIRKVLQSDWKYCLQ